MGEEKANKTESQPQSAPVDSAPPPPSPVNEKESKKEDLPNGVGQELSVIPVHKEKATSAVNEKESKKEDPPNGVRQEPSVIPVHKEKATSAVQQVAVPATKNSGALIDKDSVLARIETEKRLAFIKAWEAREKEKAENKSYKKLLAIELWENTKKATVEAQLKRIEAEYIEKMRNKMAEIHKLAEEKRAKVEAHKREKFVKLGEDASKFHAKGYTPRKILACFRG